MIDRDEAPGLTEETEKTQSVEPPATTVSVNSGAQHERVDPKSEPDPEPPDPGPPESAGAPAPPVPRPGTGDIIRVAKKLGMRRPAVAAPPTSVGPMGYVVAVRTSWGDPTEYTLELIHMQQAAEDGAAWEALPDGVFRVHDWLDDGWSETPGSIPVTLASWDYDADGEQEVLLRFRFAYVRGDTGYNSYRDMIVFNLRPLSVAMRANLDHEVEVWERKGSMSFRDLNGDKHPDVRITARELQEGKEFARREEEWRWDPATDTYIPDKRDK